MLLSTYTHCWVPYCKGLLILNFKYCLYLIAREKKKPRVISKYNLIEDTLNGWSVYLIPDQCNIRWFMWWESILTKLLCSVDVIPLWAVLVVTNQVYDYTTTPERSRPDWETHSGKTNMDRVNHIYNPANRDTYMLPSVLNLIFFNLQHQTVEMTCLMGPKCQVCAYSHHYCSSKQKHLLISFMQSFHSDENTIFSHTARRAFGFEDTGENYLNSPETKLRVNELSFLCLLKESVTHTLLHTPICNSSDLLIKRLPVRGFYRSDKDRGGLC